ncbi:MAG: ribonuclease P protein component [Rikenellaceae bacterium]
MDRQHSLPHHQRLRSRGSIRRLFESGKSGFVYPLRYMWYTEGAEEQGAEQGDEQGEMTEELIEEIAEEVVEETLENDENIKVLFTVPKRFHKRANKRNTLRRRVKESYRLQKQLLQHPDNQTDTHPRSVEIALVYSTKEFHSYKTIDHAVRKILENIAKNL